MRRAISAISLVALAAMIALDPVGKSDALAVSPAAPLSAVTAAISTPSGASSPAPLVVLIDISGSMNDSVPRSNGTGSVVKLDAAKQALEQPIINQPPGASVGIWSFPGGTTGAGRCDTGSWLVNVDSGDNSTSILRKIGGLSAGGDTPTGPALTAVVEDLKARGIESANLLVVSDGLYNCGEDPCEVARRLAGSGFTLSIQAVGFDISESGRQDLACMASATGGHYFDASDSADLNRIVTELTTPQVTLKIDGPSRPIAGQTTTITATVANPSTFDAHDVQLRLGFSDGAGLLVPTASPQTLGLGTLPARQTSSRTWTFVAGTTHFEQRAVYSVSASSVEGLPVQANGTFTTKGPNLSASDAGGILSGLIKSKESLVILGDSYSSGEGTFNYLPTVPGASQTCHRSPDTYLAPMFTAAKVRVDILACSGATSADLLTPQLDSGALKANAQLSQLDSLSGAPGAAVVTLGGNNVGFSSIVTQCVAPNQPCTDDKDWVNSALEAAKTNGLESDLVRAYENIWRVLNQPRFVTARGGRYAPLIVLAYPQVDWNYQNGKCQLNLTRDLDENETKFANRFEATLNQTTSEAVVQAQANGFGVVYSSATYNAFLPNNSVCASAKDRFVNQILQYSTITDTKPESFHPNAKGYQSESQAIIEWSRTAATPAISSAAKRIAADEASLRTLLDSIPAAPPPPARPKLQILGPGASIVVVRGQAVEITGTATLSTPASVTLHSDPRPLAVITPGSDGLVHGFVTIPADVPLGAHQLVIEGWDKTGEPVVEYAEIEVKPPTPLWVYALGVVAVLLVLAAAFLVVAFRRRLRRTALRTQPVGP